MGLVVAVESTAQSSLPGTTGIERQQIRAQLSPVNHTLLSSEIGAIVSKIAVREAGSFKRGDVLLSLDCSLQEAQLEIAQAELASAEVVLAANVRLDQLNSIGKLELDLANVAKAKAMAEVRMSETLLAKCELIAPFSGRIAVQHVRERQYVQPGEPLLEIFDDNQLELEFIVPSRWLGWLQDGHSFEVSIDETGLVYPAKISRIGARADAVSQTVKVAAIIDGEYKELKAGMSGTVQVITPTGAVNKKSDTERPIEVSL
ncbi:efflux RND transporter periplasmic adaptor subunit [Gammaproteobacteria bacterium LSUCC0112]|nr:efflux RND transporter periplasmic adaptor subunit [Gammaproteobacteria bacterium LSUCC0112]